MLADATVAGLERLAEVGQGDRFKGSRVPRGLGRKTGWTPNGGMTYLNVTEVESAVEGLARAFPSLCEKITLPHPTFEGRTCHELRVGRQANSTTGILFTGSVHACEWAEPTSACPSLPTCSTPPRLAPGFHTETSPSALGP